jgi:hypothetical protein
MLLGLEMLALSATTVSAQTAPQSGEQVMEQFERAFNAFDEEAVSRLFSTEGSVRQRGTGDAVTASQVRRWVREARDNNLHAHLGEYSVSDGKTHFIIEIGRGEWFRDGSVPQRLSGMAEIRNGRIVSLLFDTAAPPQASGRVDSGVQVAGLPLLLVAAGVGGATALVAGSLLLRRREPDREPSGHLHAALGEWASTRRRG